VVQLQVGKELVDDLVSESKSCARPHGACKPDSVPVEGDGTSSVTPDKARFLFKVPDVEWCR
jgi:hypothetical protein